MSSEIDIKTYFDAKFESLKEYFDEKFKNMDEKFDNLLGFALSSPYRSF